MYYEVTKMYYVIHLNTCTLMYYVLYIDVLCIVQICMYIKTLSVTLSLHLTLTLYDEESQMKPSGTKIYYVIHLNTFLSVY